MALQRLSVRVARGCYRRPRLVVLVHVGLFALALFGAAQHLHFADKLFYRGAAENTDPGNLLFDNSIQAIMGEKSPAIIAFKRFQEHFGAGEFVEFVVSIPTTLDERSLNRITRFVADLEAMDHNIEVFWAGRLPHAPQALKLNRVADAREVRRFLDRLAGDPLAPRLIKQYENGAAVALLIAFPPQGRDDTARARLFSQIVHTWQETKPPANWVAMGMGAPVVTAALRQAVVDSLTINFPVVNLIIVVLLLLVLRRIRIVIFALITLLQSEALIISLFVSTGHAFNYITGNIAAVIMVIGVAANIHLASSYVIRRRKTDAQGAIISAFRAVGRPCALASITTAAALLSLLYANEVAVKDFGLFAAIGLLLVILCSFTLLPALIALFDSRISTASILVPRVPNLVRLPLWSWRHAKPILVVTIGLCIVAVVGIGFLRIGTNIQNYFRADHSIRRAADFVSAHFPGFVPFEVQVSWKNGAPVDGAELLVALRNIKQAMADRIRVEGKRLKANQILTLSDLETSFCLNPDKAHLCSGGRLRPEAANVIVNSGATLGAASFVHRLAEGYTARLTVYQDPPYAAAGARLVAQLKDVAEGAAGRGSVANVTGLVALWSIKDTSVIRELISSFFLAGLIVFAIMAAIYRSRRAFAISILPNVVPLLLVLGTAGTISVWVDGHLSTPALMFTTMAIGIVVDSTLFFLLTYQNNIAGGYSGEESLRRTMAEVGAGIVLTGVCLTLGFATLILGELTPVRTLGALLSATVFLALLADLVILPALCRLYWNPSARTSV